MDNYEAIAQSIKEGPISQSGGEGVKVYEKSVSAHGNTTLVMIKEANTKFLLAIGEDSLYRDLEGTVIGSVKKCPLTHTNRLVMNRYFDYMVPRAFGTEIATIGLGDRLGIASPGHIQAVRGRDIRPILAQQSIRELALTGRDYKQVMDAAAFAVFQEGYKDGFGADGDHLKVEADIQMALELGFTMLTLDCSEKIDNTIEGASLQELEEKYRSLPESVRSHYETRYLDQTFTVADVSVPFDRQTLIKNVLIYSQAIDYMEHIYQTYIRQASRAVDFEISIDETMTPTAPESHYFVANELYERGVAIYSMAPRFCGEFQKGIDYIGDLHQFEQELAIHASIADKFGYKLSIHSGSDKFSVFALIGQYTKGRFHIKTAGTNWLEAVRTVAGTNPSLYRRMHSYALAHFEEAKAYYHVTTDISKIVPIDEVQDADLADTYLNENNARQLIHITYGILLQAVDEQGKSLFRDEFYQTLSEQEEAFGQSLVTHIGKHLSLLGK
ncbi:tagaturonate epimerase family protein [Paenibacillus eucommiae]|uniref:Tagaturonate/fructuronate epimerase n=1 Tax=Paenibacillus eucommiae TaxID=1355755 RepID=A0ABS4ITL3_9BACL|nr:hypothetical protein [Paenibacillus eucommiae]